MRANASVQEPSESSLRREFAQKTYDMIPPRRGTVRIRSELGMRSLHSSGDMEFPKMWQVTGRLQKNYKKITKRLHYALRLCFPAQMFSRSNLLFLPVTLAIGLVSFSQTTLAEEAIVPALHPIDDLDDDNDDEGNSSKSRKRATQVTPNGTRLPDSSAALSTLAQVSTMAEAEQIIVRGFDVEPVEYPALPEVEGTRINSGKKTSFVKPDEFPTVANNNYREVMATTPGILVSEEPSSPIINFGYRGLDSQRSEFMQVLKDGISIKNEQFGFPETHYTPILDAVERVEFIRAGAALQFGPSRAAP